jgi:hypothetical protein
MISSVLPPIEAGAGVADGAFDAVLAHVAIAVDLEGLVDDLEDGALGDQLRQRDLSDGGSQEYESVPWLHRQCRQQRG